MVEAGRLVVEVEAGRLVVEVEGGRSEAVEEGDLLEVEAGRWGVAEAVSSNLMEAEVAALNCGHFGYFG